MDETTMMSSPLLCGQSMWGRSKGVHWCATSFVMWDGVCVWYFANGEHWCIGAMEALHGTLCVILVFYYLPMCYVKIAICICEVPSPRCCSECPHYNH